MSHPKLIFPKNIEHKNVSFLVTVSGGVDSIVLLHLCKKEKLNVSVAHCNFQLRAENADLDEKLVKDYCQKNNLPFFSKKFNTLEFAKQNKLNTQLAARELRYNWFYDVCKKNAIDYILTAHHLDDQIETFIINLSRGTGISGLSGIPQQNNKILRPLLHLKKEEIVRFAKENDIVWREDKSNQKDDYLRNRIRHHVLPELTQIGTDFYESFSKTLSHLKQSKQFIETELNKIKSTLLSSEKGITKIDVQKLNELENKELVVFEIFKEFGMSCSLEIEKILKAETGSEIQTDSYRILKDREEILIKKKEDSLTAESIELKIDSEYNSPFFIKLSESLQSLPDFQAFFDLETLSFPLILKKPKPGDFFFPLGMNGKKKKLSKYFKDEKLNKFEKEDVWLLCDALGHILWVVGKREDERFKITEKTQKVLNIKL